MKPKEFPFFLAIGMLCILLSACSAASAEFAPAAGDSASAEVSAPDGVIKARDAALRYVEQTMDVPSLTASPVWREADITPKNLVGQTTYEFTSGEYRMTISYPVVAPENVRYTAEIKNAVTDFVWTGVVDPAGNVSDITGGGGSDAIILTGHADARDAALAFVYNHYVPDVSSQLPIAELEWDTVEVGAQTGSYALEYTSTDWIVRVEAEASAPYPQLYEVELTNQSLGLAWTGTVSHLGQITEIEFAEPAAEPEPLTEDETQVMGWLGHVESLPTGAQWDDKLVLSNSAGEVGIEGATDELRNQIVALRDQEEPDKVAHFWGALRCDVPDVGGCQLVVTRIRSGATLTEDDPVVAWQGTLVSNPPESQFEDAFVLSGDYPVAFGIASLAPELQAQLENLRDTGQTFKVWGLLRTGVIDAYGAQIQVEQIEVLP